MVTYNDVDYFYVYNLQGDVVALIDANGTQVVEYVYDAWGYPISKTGSLAATIGTLNPFRYRGYVYDEETGLYYLRNRYYKPAWRRFINADNHDLPSQFRETLGNKNLYEYCNNNPLNKLDSTGNFGLLIGMAVGAIAGAIVSGVVSAASQYVSEGKVDWEIVLVDMAFGAVGGAVSATGISLGASMAAIATLSAATYITEQSVLEEEITGTGLFASTIGGAVSGLAGGRGADAEGLGKIWKRAGRGILREQRRANTKYAAKQIAKYTAERVVVKKTVAVSVTRLIAGTVGSTVVNNKIKQIMCVY